MDDDLDFEPIQEDKVFDRSIADSIENFDSSLKERFKPEQYKKLRTIGAFIMQGLALEECCILARVDPSKMTTLMMSNPDVAAFIKFKQIAYKAHLLKSITGRAKDGDAKMSGWLLEKQYASEFNAKPVSPEEGREPHLLEAGIQFVREAGDADPLVKKQSRTVIPMRPQDIHNG